MAGTIERFTYRNVYQLAMELQQEISILSKSVPQEELYSWTDQARRASRAVGANLAESWHQRRYPAHFVGKLTDADAEQAETQHWLDTARACEYVSSPQHKALLEKCTRIGRMLGKMRSRPESFCGGRITNRRYETHCAFPAVRPLSSVLRLPPSGQSRASALASPKWMAAGLRMCYTGSRRVPAGRIYDRGHADPERH